MMNRVDVLKQIRGMVGGGETVLPLNQQRGGGDGEFPQGGGGAVAEPEMVDAPYMVSPNPTQLDQRVPILQQIQQQRRQRPDSFASPEEQAEMDMLSQAMRVEMQPRKPDPTWMSILKGIGEGIAYRDNAQNVRMQREAQRQREYQNKVDRLKQIRGDAKQREQDYNAQEDRQMAMEDRERSIQMQELQAQQINRGLEKPNLIEVSPGASLYDPTSKTSPYTAPSKDPTKKALQSKEVEINGKAALANFDPDSGKYYDTKTGAELHDVKPYNTPKDPSGATNRRVDNLSSKFGSEPIVKKYNIVTDALQFARNVPEQNNNPQYDQALIYAFAKAMDPESVVREGEYATVQKYAQSWMDSFGFNAARILSNSEFLTPEARRNMKSVIEQRAKPVVDQYKNLRKQYGQQISQITKDDGESHLVDYGAAFGDAPQPTPSLDANGRREQHNKRTGEYRYSLDGGKTWHKGRLPRG